MLKNIYISILNDMLFRGRMDVVMFGAEIKMFRGEEDSAKDRFDA